MRGVYCVEIKFWGSRGSLPKPMGNADFIDHVARLIETAKHKNIKSLDDFLASMKDGQLGTPVSYGGNTLCHQITHGQTKFFVDMGSGLREVGNEVVAEKRKNFTFFLTHMHWDHLMGMPFFLPTFLPDHKLTLYHVHKNTPEHVKILFNGVNFPLKWQDLGSSIEFKHLKLYEKINIEGIDVTPFALDHPGGSFGYRFEADGKSLAIGVDGEYKRISPKDLGNDLKFYQNLDLLVFDAQYEMEELVNRFDWGHSSPQIGIDLAIREKIKNLVLIHHDPWSSKEKLQTSFEKAKEYLESQFSTYKGQWPKNSLGPKLYSAYDGLTIDVSKL